MPTQLARLPLALAAAGALVLGTLAPAPARADADLKRFLAGAAGLAILYGVLDSKRRSQDAAPPARHWQPEARHGRGHPPPHRRPLALPARCAVEVAGRGRGQARNVLYGERCLQRAGIDVSRLARQCRVTLRTDRGTRAVYDGACLQQRQAGHRAHRGRPGDWSQRGRHR